MLGEIAKLAVELNLTGNLTSKIAGVERSLAGLNTQAKTVGGGFKTLGAGILVAGVRASVLLAAQAGAVAGAFGVMAKEGEAAARVQTIYATAIRNSGKVSTEYVAILDAQQKSLMNLSGVDDESIKTEQTRLIQMGLSGKAVAKLTPLILDMSKATGRDLLTSTLAVGKAVNGNVAGLQRYGIVIDKAKAKVDPFGSVVDALNKKFGGTTQALSGSLDARLGAFRENLANIREEAGMKLLPALTRIVDVAGKDLVPAFGKFIDRILPSVISGLDTFASMLENGGAERGIKAITDALGPMVDMLKIAAEPVKMIVKAFLSLPSQVQGVLVGAFAVNKLSGGLIGQGTGQIVKGALGGVLGGIVQRGGSPASPLFVSDVSGGLGAKGGGGLLGALGGSGNLASRLLRIGGGLALGFGGSQLLGAGVGMGGPAGMLVGAAGGAGMIAGGAAIAGPIGAIAGSLLAVGQTQQQVSAQSTAMADKLDQTTKDWLAQSPKREDLLSGLAGVEKGINDLQANPLNVLVQGEALDRLNTMRDAIKQQLAAKNAIPASQRNPDRFDRAGMTDAVAKGTEAGIIHSPLFAKARAIREAAGAPLSLDVLRGGAGFGKFAGKVGAADVETSAEAVALAQTSRLGTDPSQASLRSAAYNLSIIKADQKRLPADLASKLQPKIRSLELAIKQTTAAVDRATAAIRHIPGALGPILPGDTRSEGRSMGPGRANPTRSTSLPGDTRSEGRSMNVNVSVSTRDINNAQTLRARYGPTPTRVGAQ